MSATVDALASETTVIHAVMRERLRQDQVYGTRSIRTLGPLEALAVLTEEVGEVARHIMEKDLQQTRKELVQVAACAVAMAARLDDQANAETLSA